jgi:hypothetical protein
MRMVPQRAVLRHKCCTKPDASMQPRRKLSVVGSGTLARTLHSLQQRVFTWHLAVALLVLLATASGVAAQQKSFPDAAAVVQLSSTRNSAASGRRAAVHNTAAASGALPLAQEAAFSVPPEEMLLTANVSTSPTIVTISSHNGGGSGGGWTSSSSSSSSSSEESGFPVRSALTNVLIYAVDRQHRDTGALVADTCLPWRMAVMIWMLCLRGERGRPQRIYGSDSVQARHNVIAKCELRVGGVRAARRRRRPAPTSSRRGCASASCI